MTGSLLSYTALLIPLIYMTLGANIKPRLLKESLCKYLTAIKPKSQIRGNDNNWPSYEIENIGWGEVVINMTRYSKQYNDKIIYQVLYPGQKISILQDTKYRGTKYIISNNMNSRAIIYFYGRKYSQNEEYPPFNYDKIYVLKSTFNLAVKHIPNVDLGLSALLSNFWPESNTNVWNQVYEMINPLLSTTKKKTISAVIKNFEHIKQKLISLNNKKDNRNKAYLKLAEELVGLEQKFILKSFIFRKLQLAANFYILPLYSSVITMKMHFYAIGIAKPEVFQLNEQQVAIVQQYAKKTLYGEHANGAINYVKNMQEYAIKNTYETVFPGALYNAMMTTRTHIALHGLELLPVWEKAYTTPGSEENPYIDVISFSHFYGSASPSLFKQSTLIEKSSLIPPLGLDNKRLKLIAIEFHMGQGEFVLPFVTGIKLIYENDYIISMGTSTKDVNRLNLNNRTITKLIAYGGAYVDCFTVNLSDGTYGTFGYIIMGSNSQEFQLKDHHIISLYVEKDRVNEKFLANVAVSSMQDPITKEDIYQ